MPTAASEAKADAPLGAHTDETAHDASDRGTSAARMYTQAEARVEEERYPEAVQLLRHAARGLPEPTATGSLRHKLVLRTAYVQMLAFNQTRDGVFLEDARRMLAQHLAAHEAALGDGESARAERGDVYEILYAVESFEQAPDVVVATEPEAPDVVSIEPGTVDVHAGENLEDNTTREVRVRRPSRLANLDDPDIRAALESRSTLPESGLVLTAGEIAVSSIDRGLVRLVPGWTDRRAWPADGVDAGRPLTRQLFRSAQPELVGCYEVAFARHPTDTVRVTVDASLAVDGTVSDVRVVEGELVDAQGDECLIEAITRARPTGATPRIAQIRLPLLFFFQPLKLGEVRAPHVGAAFELPPIEVFHGFQPPPPRAISPKINYAGAAGSRAASARSARRAKRKKPRRRRRRSAPRGSGPPHHTPSPPQQYAAASHRLGPSLAITGRGACDWHFGGRGLRVPGVCDTRRRRA